jgi:hypothetical protein
VANYSLASTGFYDNLKQETATEDESSVEELRAAYIRKCTLPEPQEDPWRMKLSLSAYSHLPPLNDSQLRESIFGGVCGPVDSHTDVEGDGSSPHSVLDDQNTRFESDRHTEFYENLRSSRSFENGTAYTDGEGCGNLLATHLRVDLKALERLMPYPTQLPSFQVCSSIPHLNLMCLYAKRSILHDMSQFPRCSTKMCIPATFLHLIYEYQKMDTF